MCCWPAISSVHITTSCKSSLLLLRMGEFIARNMLSWWKSSINCYCFIYLVVYFIVSVMHGHTNMRRDLPITFSVFVLLDSNSAKNYSLILEYLMPIWNIKGTYRRQQGLQSPRTCVSFLPRPPCMLWPRQLSNIDPVWLTSLQFADMYWQKNRERAHYVYTAGLMNHSISFKVCISANYSEKSG